MNLKTALKKKNKLVATIKEEWQKVSTYNSTDVDAIPVYDPLGAFARWKAASEELVVLKTEIHKANTPVFDLIFRMAEYKSQITFLKSLDCNEGKITPSRSYGNVQEPYYKKAAISIIKKDEMIKELESKIEEIQNELDEFNFNTSI